MVKAFTISFLLFLAQFIHAQNLVPNPSFEDTVGCPTGPDQVMVSKFWYTPTLTSSDYYNTCADPYPLGPVSIPLNWLGNQEPKTGNAYVGIGFDFGPLNPNYREYVQAKLINPLSRGHVYQVSFYCSLADSSAIAISQMGALLTATPIGSVGDPMINESPQIRSKKDFYITDTKDWVEIKGIFIAKGTENYITIGHFLDNNLSDTLHIYKGFATYNQSYYYIDDVSLTEISVSEFPNVFSPNGDGINDEFDLRISCSNCDFDLQIYNRWGNLLVTTETFKWNGEFNNEKCADGVYYYILRDRVSLECLYSSFFHLKN